MDTHQHIQHTVNVDGLPPHARVTAECRLIDKGTTDAIADMTIRARTDAHGTLSLTVRWDESGIPDRFTTAAEITTRGPAATSRVLLAVVLGVLALTAGLLLEPRIGVAGAGLAIIAALGAATRRTRHTHWATSRDHAPVSP